LAAGLVVVSLSLGPAPAQAATVGDQIVATAQAIQGQSYPQESFGSATYVYCFGGGSKTGASPGWADPASDGSYSDCNAIGRTGFDCRGFATYAVYQGTGGAVTLPNSTAGAQYNQASSYGGSYISLSALQPGDLVFFGSSASNIEHVGIVVTGTGTSAQIISATSEKYGIGTHTVAWFQAGFAWTAAVGIPGVGNPGGGGAIPDGTFIQVSGSSAIYRVAGGAPLYVSTWNAFGGSQPYTVISQAQFSTLNSVPRNGTFIADTSDGRVYEIAGGAPLYISAADASQVPGWGVRPVIGVDHYDVANNNHLNAYPADGTFICNVDDGRVYETAGGAPLYISAADATQVPGYNSGAAVVVTSGWEFSNYNHLRPYPADGTFISNVDDGRVYETAGGAAFYISTSDAPALPTYDNGATVVPTSGWEFSNDAHLRKQPLVGTRVLSEPSGRAWSFNASCRMPTTPSGNMLVTPDSGLSAFDRCPTVATTSLKTAHTGRPYRQKLAVAGGTRPFLWTIKSGHLPKGLRLSRAGWLKGTTMVSGRFALTIRVTDSNSPPSQATRRLILRVRP
jgi:hypothetical protein